MICIVTITYNDFNGLKRTLSSIPDYDFIGSVVINGGSDKATIDFLNSCKVKVINEKDEGIADAFNKGIVNSSGDAVMFLNSGDELIDPVYLKESEQILKTMGLSIVAFRPTVAPSPRCLRLFPTCFSLLDEANS